MHTFEFKRGKAKAPDISAKPVTSKDSTKVMQGKRADIGGHQPQGHQNSRSVAKPL